LIEHELHLDLKAKPVKQQLCRFAQDKKDVIMKEIARLLGADFIKEMYHLDWLANPVLVPKKIKIEGCVLIILILIRHAKKILLGFPGMIRLWTPQSVVAF
jgi:hypothetical protein